MQRAMSAGNPVIDLEQPPLRIEAQVIALLEAPARIGGHMHGAIAGVRARQWHPRAVRELAYALHLQRLHGIPTNFCRTLYG